MSPFIEGPESLMNLGGVGKFVRAGDRVAFDLEGRTHHQIAYDHKILAEEVEDAGTISLTTTEHKLGIAWSSKGFKNESTGPHRDKTIELLQERLPGWTVYE